MTATVSKIYIQDQTPAEILLHLKKTEVMRLCYWTPNEHDEKFLTELFIWICPDTEFLEGLNVVESGCVSAISERPLNIQQLLQLINATSFQDGTDIIELTTETKVEDLQRLHKLIQQVT